VRSLYMSFGMNRLNEPDDNMGKESLKMGVTMDFRGIEFEGV
jgi:hypothetical protein